MGGDADAVAGSDANDKTIGRADNKDASIENDASMIVGLAVSLTSVCCCCLFGLLALLMRRRRRKSIMKQNVLERNQTALTMYELRRKESQGRLFHDRSFLKNIGPGKAPDNAHWKKKGRMCKKSMQKRRSINVAKMKKQFGQQSISNPLNKDSAQVEMVEFGDGNPLYRSAKRDTAPGIELRPSEFKKTPSFRAHKDDLGREYYHDELTDETTWIKPDDERLIQEETKSKLKKKPSFRAHKDDLGREYYHDELTDETTWIRPDEESLIQDT